MARDAGRTAMESSLNLCAPKMISVQRQRGLRTRGAWLFAVGAAVAVLGAAPSIRAADPAAAEALFRDGKALLDGGRLSEACPKLEQSQRLDPSSGTLLNLALCHEKQGRLATAWAEYLMAARMAHAQSHVDRAAVAAERASVLEPKLSYLTLTVTSKVPGTVIRRAGTEIDESALGTRLPVDPGEQLISISAPGYKTLELKVEIKPAAEAQTVVLPALEKQSDAPAATATRLDDAALPADTPPKTPVAGWVIGGFGVAALGVGGALGVSALSKYDEAHAACPAHKACSADAVNLRNGAETRANVSNVAIGAGLLAIGVGLYVILTSSPGGAKPARGALQITPLADAKAGGLFVGGAF